MPKSITSQLGIHGLKKLDAVVLSALATNATVLVIGPHGSAKTLLTQRVRSQKPAIYCSSRHNFRMVMRYYVITEKSGT